MSRTAKVSALTRCLAKGADFFVILLVSVLIPYPAGIFVGLLYMLTQDGFAPLKGQSLGKRLFRLKTVSSETGEVCTLKSSAIRNALAAVVLFFALIPIWGWVLSFMLGVPLLALEIYLMRKLESGARLGDVMAETKVIEVGWSTSTNEPKA